MWIKEGKIRIGQKAVEPVPKVSWFRKQRQQVNRKYGLGDDEVVLGYVGRLSTEKRIGYLIETGAELVQAHVAVRLLMIGDGPQGMENPQMVRDRGLEQNVVFAGFQKDVIDMLPAFDIFILPSLTESTSMALLEAMTLRSSRHRQLPLGELPWSW